MADDDFQRKKYARQWRVEGGRNSGGDATTGDLEQSAVPAYMRGPGLSALGVAEPIYFSTVLTPEGLLLLSE